MELIFFDGLDKYSEKTPANTRKKSVGRVRSRRILVLLAQKARPPVVVVVTVNLLPAMKLLIMEVADLLELQTLNICRSKSE